MRLRYALLSLLLLTAASAALAAEVPPPALPPPTLEATYLGLSYGPLRQAQLVPLPEGVLARAAGLEFTAAQLADQITVIEEGDPIRPLLEKNSPYLLERLATSALLLAEARAWAQKTSQPADPESPGSQIETYLQSLASGAKVSPEEMKAFFNANQALFQGATYDQVEPDLRSYLLAEKGEALIADHVNRLSERTPVELNSTWFQAHAPIALDTPVDHARRSGRVSLVDFGAGGCMACDMMTPLLEELRGAYADRANVLFASVRDNPLLGNRYNIRVIPVQVLFDAQGKEVFRHEGFWAKEAMVAKLTELGVK
jgi:thiol-disulfide isomerase/thioredoxin